MLMSPPRCFLRSQHLVCTHCSPVSTSVPLWVVLKSFLAFIPNALTWDTPHSPGTLPTLLGHSCPLSCPSLLSLGTLQELSRGTSRLQHLQAWGMALPHPQTPPERAAGAGGRCPVSHSPSPPRASIPVTSPALFSFLPGDAPQAPQERRALLPRFVQEFVALKEKEGERGRKMLCGVLRISSSQQMC